MSLEDLFEKEIHDFIEAHPGEDFSIAIDCVARMLHRQMKVPSAVVAELMQKFRSEINPHKPPVSGKDKDAREVFPLSGERRPRMIGLGKKPE
jgi:hypothetical protein